MKEPKFTIELSGIKPLSVNKAWRGGPRYRTQDYIEYERMLSYVLPRRLKPIEGEVEINYIFHLKNYSRFDLDNCIKCLQDILVKRNYIEDDRKIIKFSAEKIKNPVDSIYFEIIKRANITP